MNNNYKFKVKNWFLVVFALVCPIVFGQSKFKVTLDAGHGGKDFGANYHGHVEKNIALAVALKLGQILEKQSDVAVNYTRKTDVFIDLLERANIANKSDANIFVSIHCNANVNQTADGTETYVMGMTKNESSLAVAKAENEVITLEKDYKQKYKGYNPNSPESMIGLTLMQEEYLETSISLASKIEHEFYKIGKKLRGDKGVKQAPYMVLHKAAMPRVLIEMGFISNKVEGRYLDSDEGQAEIAQAITNAILRYKREYFESTEDEISEKKKETNDIKKDTPKVTTPNSPILNNPANSGTIYKVQISASPIKLDTLPQNFKGLQKVSYLLENKLYKYYYGATPDSITCKNLLQQAKKKGFKSAFIVTFKNGKKI